MTSRFVGALGVLLVFGPAVHAADFTLRLPLGLQEQAAYVPDDNPLTAEEIALGKQLFWDTRWSRNGTIACLSCHDPNHGSVRSLAEVVALYNRGGTPNPWLSGELRPLGLTNDEQVDLVAFLEALTGEVAAEVTPPPRLPQ